MYCQDGAEKWKHCDHDDAKWIDHLIKAPMWHGGKVELLHTNVSEGEYGDAIIQGGVSLNFNFQTHDDGEFSWSPTNWLLHKIQGNANEYIQVCFLICNSGGSGTDPEVY